MATYSESYPALPPLASGQPDAPAPAVSINQAFDDQHMSAAELQYEHRKHLFENGLGATAAEVNSAKKRKIQIDCENARVATPAIQQQLTQILNAINYLNTRLDDPNTGLTAVNTGLAALGTRLRKEEFRNINRFSIRKTDDPIKPVPNDSGNLPAAANVWFPTDVAALEQARGVNQMDGLIDFYGLAAGGNNTDKRRRLRVHLGIPI